MADDKLRVRFTHSEYSKQLLPTGEWVDWTPPPRDPNVSPFVRLEPPMPDDEIVIDGRDLEGQPIGTTRQAPSVGDPIIFDTPPTIPPALTKEEWEHARRLAEEIDTLRFQLDCVQPDDFGAMAIANHRLPDGHPGKITRADVEACLSTARHWEGIADNSHEWGHRETQYEWERRASKFAALLPPDGA